MAMEILWVAACLVAVTAEPPVPQTFRGYEKGGYEIGSEDLKPFPGADQLNFPGSSDVTGGAPGSGSQPSGPAEEFPQDQREGGRGRGQQRGSSRFEGGSLNDLGGGGLNDFGGEGEEGSLDDIPGVAGKDYPIYGEIPKTSFSCDQQSSPGYYADLETQCQVFHICQKGGQMNSVLCPNGTIFNQGVFVCSWWYDFDCASAPGLFALNAQVSAEGEAASPKGGRRGGAQDTRESPSGDQSSREFPQISEDVQNSLGGYQENGPRPAKLEDFAQDGQNFGHDGQNFVQGSQNFESVGGAGNGGVENILTAGTNLRLEDFGRNDLTTSDGYPSGRPDTTRGTGGAGYPRGGRGRTPSADVAQDGNGGYSRGGSQAQREQNREYIPPGEGAPGASDNRGGFNDGQRPQGERSYLPPS